MNIDWNGIYGQESVKNILERLIKNSSIPHAFLFYGANGIGKEYTAIKFAQNLNNCLITPEESEKISKQIATFSEPYIKYITPLPRGKSETDTSGPFEKLSAEENELYHEELAKKIQNPYYKIRVPKATQIKISSIRDIKKYLSFNFSDVKYRVVILSDAHLMNEEAQNALLKNLEEPPEGIIFILCTPFPGLLRETVRSRCWSIPFQPLKESELVKLLVNKFEISKNEASQVAPFAGGSLSSALNLLDQDIERLIDKTIYILRYSFGRKYHSALMEINKLLEENAVENLRIVIQMIITWLKDVQKFRFRADKYFFEKHVETLEKFNTRFPDLKLNDIVSKLDRFASVLKNNINPNLIALNIIFELASLTIPKKEKNRALV